MAVIADLVLARSSEEAFLAKQRREGVDGPIS